MSRTKKGKKKERSSSGKGKAGGKTHTKAKDRVDSDGNSKWKRRK